MIRDGMIWHVLDNFHCSYKVTAKDSKFCKNEYNVSGICSEFTCPLANSLYATVLEREGKLFLYMKTAERAHTPAKLWEKIPLSKNYQQALAQLEEHLEFFPAPIRDKNKLRLKRIFQILKRMRKLSKQEQVEIVPRMNKVERRLKKREAKALVAAKLEKSIENELLDRLANHTYGDIYNAKFSAFAEQLDAIEDVNSEASEEYVEAEDSDEYEMEMEMDDEPAVDIQYTD